MEFCHSCTMPLEMPGARSKLDNLCTHCVGKNGKLKKRSEARAGIAGWLKSWQGVSDEVALQRARYFMRAMPAWAKDGASGKTKKASSKKASGKKKTASSKTASSKPSKKKGTVKKTGAKKAKKK